MDKVIVYGRPDGGVSIVVPAPQARRSVIVPIEDGGTIARPETDEEFIARIAAKDVPISASNVRVMQRSALPADRTYRDAWRSDFTVDMTIAREVQRARIRAARANELERLDIAYQRADEVGNVAEKQRIAAAKQALRDAPADPRIDAAKTPEELKLAWPQGLPTTGLL